MISFHYVVFMHFYLQLDVRLVLFILVDWTIVFCFISSWHYFRMIYDLLALKLLYRKTETYMTDIYWFRSVPDCVCLCMYVCLWHVSLRMFNVFTIPLRKIRLKAFATDINNQLAWKCIKKTCHTVFGLDVAGRLVVNACYVKLTEDQVRVSLCIFRDFSFSTSS
jgi:hypothetical protein